jgi:phytoene synthase
MDEKNLKSGYLEAKNITKCFAKTFYLASLFFPKDKRMASYTIYAICRISDDSIDHPENNSGADNLEKIKKTIETAYTDEPIKDNLLIAFRKTVKTYLIPKELFLELIEGLQMDLTIKRYPNFNSLHLYCYRVAGVIGLIMLKILKAQNQDAKQPAIDLGIAFQLTNILRDVKEDFLRGRIYLPLDELRNFNLSEETIKNGEISEDFRLFMQFQLNRARDYYAKSSSGIKMLCNLRSRFVIALMANLYREILNEIEKSDYSVLSKRSSVSGAKKLLIILTTILKGEYL